ncbi:Transcriptional regulatory protein sin3 [Exophiala xenobiotica]
MDERDTEHEVQQTASLCRTSFTTIFAAIGTNKLIVERISQIFYQRPGEQPIFTLSDLRDEFEQFQIWAENIGDRDHDKQLEGTNSPVDDSESSDDDDEPLTDVELTAFEIQSRLGHVSDVITKLCRLAHVIRASGARSRTIKAASYVHYENGIDETKAFEEQYLPIVLRHRFQLTDPLLSRMCKVIALRRRRFLYQMAHQKGLAYGVRVEKSPTIEEQPTDKAVTPIESTYNYTNRHLSATQPDQAPSALTRPTNATTFRGLPLKRSAPSTLVASTARLALGATDIPPAPAIANRASHFQCPYCYLLVEQHKATPKSWRKHLISDLQPFVCIEPDCNDPYVLMETWADWVEHHKWAHAMEWWCEGLETSHQPASFTVAEEYSEHLLHDHMSTLTVRDVSRMVQTSGAPAQEPFKFCPFCDYQADSARSLVESDTQDTLKTAKLGQQNLQSHIFDHLLSMFLLALPGRDDIEDGGSEDDDHGVPRSSIVTGNRGSSRSAASRPLSSFTDGSALLFNRRAGDTIEPAQDSLGRPPFTGNAPGNDSFSVGVMDGADPVNSSESGHGPSVPEPLAANTPFLPAAAPLPRGQKPIMENALDYLDHVKLRCSDRPDVYNDFLAIMKDFQAQVIDTADVIDRMLSLFNDDPMLIQGFNIFLPPGYLIECRHHESPDAIRLTTPSGNMTKSLRGWPQGGSYY